MYLPGSKKASCWREIRCSGSALLSLELWPFSTTSRATFLASVPNLTREAFWPHKFQPLQVTRGAVRRRWLLCTDKVYCGRVHIEDWSSRCHRSCICSLDAVRRGSSTSRMTSTLPPGGSGGATNGSMNGSVSDGASDSTPSDVTLSILLPDGSVSDVTVEYGSVLASAAWKTKEFH